MIPNYTIIAFSTLLLSPVVTAFAAEGPTRPNILWLVSEDNDTFLGCFGDPLARTPTLDQLAKKGVVFERCFAQPVCAPSRFTLISGMFAMSCGPAEHMRASGKIPSWLNGFPTLLRTNGYFGSNNSKTDYNSPIDPQKTWDEQGKRAHYRNRKDPKQPFFSVFNHEVTHESCLFPEKSPALDFPPTDPSKVRIPPYQPDTPEIRADWARYYDCITLMDKEIGAKLKDLEEAGLADDTIVFYYADNGGVLPRSKRFLQESGTHVPLIVYFPPKWQHLAPAAPGSRISDPVSFVDFAPTVLSLAGVKIPDYMQGRPFAGQAKTQPSEFVYCTRDRMDERYDMVRSVMDKRWLYIRNFRPDLAYVQPLAYMFQGRGYQSWARVAAEGKLTAATSMFWGSKPTEELYDMAADPDSVTNLAKDPAHQPTLNRMRGALKKHSIDVIDNGFAPEGSALEGYDAVRVSGAYPIERIYEIARLASERSPESLSELVAAIEDPCEAIRWWALQGVTMLASKARPAETAVIKALKDTSGAIQIAAAEALVALGKPDLALPVLEKQLDIHPNPSFTLQAANVLNRIGESARPLLPAMKEAVAKLSAMKPDAKMDANTVRYPKDLLSRTIGELEGTVPRLVYPTPSN
ncbi:MAG: sulfatase-like hydrolase/transferase [Verrucomicrobiota bacterium]